jgi:hypothetical protein
MGDWKIDRSACLHTWGVLLGLGERNGAFSQEGASKVNTFEFWVDTDSADIRAIKAGGLAAALDVNFDLQFLARYVAGSNKAAAIAKMSAVLVSGDKTMSDLADVVEANYVFRA